MRRFSTYILSSLVVLTSSATYHAQGKPNHQPESIQSKQTSSIYESKYPPLQDAATEDQIREYLRVSGEMGKYRARLIGSVDRVRYIGKPYWPESFWTSLKNEMQKDDLTPVFIALFKHCVSKDLMQEVLNSYRQLGSEKFVGSPAWIKLEKAKWTIKDDTEQLLQSESETTIRRVYQIYQPQIKVARTKYIAEHPDWKDN
jgi:hypothetical protein